MPAIPPADKPKTLKELMAAAKAIKPKPACIACGDSGRSTSGQPCHPCVVAGRIKR